MTPTVTEAPSLSANASHLLALLQSALARDDSTHALVATRASILEICDMVDPEDHEATRAGLALLSLVASQDVVRGEAIAAVLLQETPTRLAWITRSLTASDPQTRTCGLQLLSVLLRCAPDTASVIDASLRESRSLGLSAVLSALGSDQPATCASALRLLAGLASEIPARAATLFASLSRGHAGIGLQALVQRTVTMPELRGPTCELLAALVHSHEGRKAVVHAAMACEAGGVGLRQAAKALESRDARTYEPAIELLAELAADHPGRRDAIALALHAPGCRGRLSILDRLRCASPSGPVLRLLRSLAETGGKAATELMVDLSMHERTGLKRILFVAMTQGSRQGDAAALLACLARAKPLWGRIIFELANEAGPPLRGLDSLLQGLSPLRGEDARHTLALLHALSMVNAAQAAAIHAALLKVTRTGACGIDQVIELAGTEDLPTQRQAICLLAEMCCQCQTFRASLLTRLSEGATGRQGLDMIVGLLDHRDASLQRVALALLTELALASREAGRLLLDCVAPPGGDSSRLAGVIGIAAGSRVQPANLAMRLLSAMAFGQTDAARRVAAALTAANDQGLRAICHAVNAPGRHTRRLAMELLWVITTRLPDMADAIGRRLIEVDPDIFLEIAREIPDGAQLEAMRVLGQLARNCATLRPTIRRALGGDGGAPWTQVRQHAKGGGLKQRAANGLLAALGEASAIAASGSRP